MAFVPPDCYTWSLSYFSMRESLSLHDPWDENSQIARWKNCRPRCNISSNTERNVKPKYCPRVAKEGQESCGHYSSSHVAPIKYL
uniref:Uncharacterized protein n=1 Tax=Anguilla anguilla TaxID=7936 RepID=A0A0E9TKT0_ANGAN